MGEKMDEPIRYTSPIASKYNVCDTKVLVEEQVAILYIASGLIERMNIHSDYDCIAKRVDQMSQEIGIQYLKDVFNEWENITSEAGGESLIIKALNIYRTCSIYNGKSGNLLGTFFMKKRDGKHFKFSAFQPVDIFKSSDEYEEFKRKYYLVWTFLEDKNKIKKLLDYKTSAAKTPGELQNLAVRMGITENTLQSIIDRLKIFNKGEILDGKIFISSKNPEKAVAGILWALNEIIKNNDDEMIESCFIKEEGEWNKKNLHKYRSKFSTGTESKTSERKYKEMFKSLLKIPD